MLITDIKKIGEKLYSFRKLNGMTQAELAEAARVSDRTYADIERGTVNMRTETLLSICEALHITPDEVLTDCSPVELHQDEVFARLSLCPPAARQTALDILDIYIKSLKQ